MESIISTYSDYKYVLVVRYEDNREIQDMTELLSLVDITYTGGINVEDALDSIYEKIEEIEDEDKEIIVPFDMKDKYFNIYKHNNVYAYDNHITDYFIRKENGVVVYVSPNGTDEASGLTVNTPLRTIEAALEVSNVETIILLEGTYTAGINYNVGLKINSRINLVGIGTVIIDNVALSNNSSINFRTSCYVRNIHFKHGNNTVIATLGADDTAIFDECIFSESDNALWSNGLSVVGGSSCVYKCIAYDNAYDGFNYRANNSVKNYNYEVACLSYNNGNTNLAGENGQSSNGSTSHDGSYIVRLDGSYYACHGGIIADLNCISANYNCKSGISTITDAINYPDRMSNYWCSGGTMYLFDCDSYGSKYDTAVVSNGNIISNKSYSSVYPEK